MPRLYLQLCLPHLRWTLGRPWSALRNDRGQTNAEEESGRGVPAPLHSPTHSEGSLQQGKILDDKREISAFEGGKRKARSSQQSVEPKEAKQSWAGQTQIPFRVHHAAQIPLIHEKVIQIASVHKSDLRNDALPWLAGINSQIGYAFYQFWPTVVGHGSSLPERCSVFLVINQDILDWLCMVKVDRLCWMSILFWLHKEQLQTLI